MPKKKCFGDYVYLFPTFQSVNSIKLCCHWHTQPEASVTQRSALVRSTFFYSPFVFHLNPTCTVKSTFQNWGRKRPYCPCTPDLALGHGDCAVKVELYGFLRSWKPVCAFHVSQKCQLPEIQDVTGVLDTENTGLWTLKAAASTVDIVPIWVARSTPQQLPLVLLKRKKVCQLGLSTFFLTAFLKQVPLYSKFTSYADVTKGCWSRQN